MPFDPVLANHRSTTRDRSTTALSFVSLDSQYHRDAAPSHPDGEIMSRSDLPETRQLGPRTRLLATGASPLMLLAALALSCAHLPRVKRVAKGDPRLASVIYYALPRTVVTVHASVRREETEAGRCSGDAVWLTSRLGPKAQPKRDALRYEIHDWRVTTRAEPDPEAVFAMTITSDTFSDGNQAIELSHHGLLLLDSAEGTAVIPGFVSSAIELGGSLLAKAMPSAGIADPKLASDHFCKEAKKHIEDMDLAETKLIGDAINDPAKRANLELLLKEVRATRDQLLLHFTGRVVEKNDYGIQCEFTPASLPVSGEAPEQMTALFTFDPKAGLTAVPGVRCAFPGEVIAELAGGRPIKVGVNPAAGFAVAVRDSAMAADPLKDPSLYYRPASSATISIEDGSTVHASSVQTIAQLGPILWLPGEGDIRAFRAKYEIALHPGTGALKSVAMTASGAGPKPATPPSDASTATPAAVAPDSGKPPNEGVKKGAHLEALERERMILEEQQKIERLKSGQGGQP